MSNAGDYDEENLRKSRMSERPHSSLGILSVKRNKTQTNNKTSPKSVSSAKTTNKPNSVLSNIDDIDDLTMDNEGPELFHTQEEDLSFLDDLNEYSKLAIIQKKLLNQKKDLEKKKIISQTQDGYRELFKNRGQVFLAHNAKTLRPPTATFNINKVNSQKKGSASSSLKVLTNTIQKENDIIYQTKESLSGRPPSAISSLTQNSSIPHKGPLKRVCRPTSAVSLLSQMSNQNKANDAQIADDANSELEYNQNNDYNLSRNIALFRNQELNSSSMSYFEKIHYLAQFNGLDESIKGGGSGAAYEKPGGPSATQNYFQKKNNTSSPFINQSRPISTGINNNNSRLPSSISRGSANSISMPRYNSSGSVIYNNSRPSTGAYNSTSNPNIYSNNNDQYNEDTYLGPDSGKGIPPVSLDSPNIGYGKSVTKKFEIPLTKDPKFQMILDSTVEDFFKNKHLASAFNRNFVTHVQSGRDFDWKDPLVRQFDRDILEATLEQAIRERENEESLKLVKAKKFRYEQKKMFQAQRQKNFLKRALSHEPRLINQLKGFIGEENENEDGNNNNINNSVMDEGNDEDFGSMLDKNTKNVFRR